MRPFRINEISGINGRTVQAVDSQEVRATIVDTPIDRGRLWRAGNSLVGSHVFPIKKHFYGIPVLSPVSMTPSGVAREQSALPYPL